jgi:RND superfamily putative drug exporter
MFTRIARAVTHRPWLVIAGWAVAAAALIALAPRLDGVTNADQAAFLPSSAESAQAAALARQAFPGTPGSTAVVVLHRSDRTALTEADVGTLTAVAARLGTVAFDPGRSVSPNRLVALYGTAFPGPAEESATRSAVAELRGAVSAALAGTGIESAVTGQAAIVVDNQRALADAERIVTLVTVGLIVVLLLVIFRSPVAAVLPLATVGLVYGVATALVASAATVLDQRVGQELPTMLTVVLFGIGTDYILFLLFRYRERLRAGDAPAAAIVAAVERVGQAIFSAAFAVIAAFGALVLALLGFFRTLGPALAIGGFVMLLAALTLVPAVVSVLGRAVFWPVAPSTRTRPGRGFAAIGRLVARRPWAVATAGLALLGGMAAGVFAFTADYDPVGQLPARTEAARAFTDLKAGFPAGALQPTDVYLRADRPLTTDEVSAFVGRLRQVPGVAAARPSRSSADQSTVDIELILVDEPFSAGALDLVGGPLREAARAAAPPGTTTVLGGQTMAFADVRSTTDRDLRVIFPVAGILFALILAGLLRALVAPVYLVGLVVLGFLATLGATAAVFGRVAFTIPIVLYLFVTAIGTDYNILMTARIREEVRDGRAPREAARLAVTQAGPSVAAAALILAGTFGALTVTGVPFFTQIGFAVGLGILLVAFVISLLLVPAITALRTVPGRPAGVVRHEELIHTAS